MTTKTNYSELSGPDQVRAYNDLVARAVELGSKDYKRVERFADRAAGAKRCDCLASTVRAIEEGQRAAASQKGPDAGTEVIEGRADGRTRSDATAAPAEVKAPRAPRAVGKPAGRPEDFRPVRSGTARAKIVSQIPTDVPVKIDTVVQVTGIDRKTLMVHLACLHRDCAIGYEVDGDGVRLVLPEGKTTADAVADPKPAKRPARD